MLDAREGAPVVLPERAQLLDILQGNLGFHFTVDRALPTALQHGLLSRDEERKRGLRVRTGASRSYSDAVYFTTRFNNLYFHRDYDKSLQESLEDVVGIIEDRPDFARNFRHGGNHGHYGEQDVVEPERFRALVFVDRETLPKEKPLQRDVYDEYAFRRPLPEEQVRERVAALRRICEAGGRDIPIYGISGDLYWPERMTRGDVIKALTAQPATQ